MGLIAIPTNQTGPAHGWHGNLLLVRNALIQKVHHLVLPGFEPRGAMVTDVEMDGRPLRVVNTHLGLLPGSRAMQARALIDKIALMEDRPTLLMGDLNEWRGGSAMLRTLGERFNINAPLPSFPARYPLVAFDRMMMCPQGELLDLAIHDSPVAYRASDHLPIKARLRFSVEKAL